MVNVLASRTHHFALHLRCHILKNTSPCDFGRVPLRGLFQDNCKTRLCPHPGKGRFCSMELNAKSQPARVSHGALQPSMTRTPPTDRVWNPEQGIVFSEQSHSPAQAYIASVEKRDGVGRSLGSRRAFSTSTLDSLGGEDSVIAISRHSIPRVKSETGLASRQKERRVVSFDRRTPNPGIQERNRAGQDRIGGGLGITELLQSAFQFLFRVCISVSRVLRLHSVGALVPAKGTEAASDIVPEAITHQSLSTSQPSKVPQRQYWTYRTGRSWRKIPQVCVCVDLATSETIAAQFLNAAVVGLDLEWQVGATVASDIKSRISVIQVAKDDLIAIFHIARFPGTEISDLLAPSLKRLIESPQIYKTGVNIAGDCTRLRKHLGVDARGVVELSATYRLVKYHNGTLDDIRKINKTLVSLATQVEEHLGLPLFKESDVRTSDWAKPLSAQQTLYAASDAYACLCLWYVLDAKREALQPTPPPPSCHELKLPIVLANGMTVPEYLKYVKDLED